MTALSARSRVAVVAGRLAATLSRALGLGAGGVLGGRVALAVSPSVLRELSSNKKIVLVTGTNGKSTTSRLAASALGTMGEVAANSRGDNMPTGIVSALMDAPGAPIAVLEVDEMHLPQVAAQTSPDAIILLNLSRDQLDRVGEIGNVEARLRQAVEANPQAWVIANCDDPLVASSAWDAPKVQWVSVGAPWQADSTSFPRTGTLVERSGDFWNVRDHPEFCRPEPDWSVLNGSVEGLVGAQVRQPSSLTLAGPNGLVLEAELSVPGRANRGNAAQAAAAAIVLGADPGRVGAALGEVQDVAGRYATYDVDGRGAHLLLAKNPAGWQEALSMVPADTTQVVIATNGQVPDGVDMSWLWDVRFEALADLDATIVVSGERSADLAVRLEYAGIPFRLEQSPLAAIKSLQPGPVQVLANYTAFRDLLKELSA